MPMTTQDWQGVESRRDLAKPRKPADPMLYLAILVILAAISTLVMVFYSIRSAYDHLPDRLWPNSVYKTQES